MSFGGSVNSQTIKDAISSAYEKKIVLVAAAGNEYTDTPMYPAAYPEVLSVAAVDIGAERAEYSNFGTSIDIAAPGGFESLDLDFDGYKDGIFSTYFNNDFTYSYASGTSMAAPHVSGVAAIVIKALQVRGVTDISPQTVKSYLTDSAINIGNPDYYGSGLVNAYAAASKALGQPNPQLPVLFPFPKTVKLTGMTSSGSFVLKNIGKVTPITITSIESIYGTKDLISNITPQSGEIGTDGLSVQVTLDTAGLRDGRTYSARIDITDLDENLEYVYALYKYIGDVYVVALDASSHEIVQIALTSYEEDFQYLLDNLPQGEYIIGASTDRDENGIIFEFGEVYGFFQSVSNQVSIRLISGVSLEGVNFQIIDELL
jgi:serine protease